ncbi:MAG: stage III sporulation protein AG [Peptostreptococcaceae bacterium]
MGEVEKKGDNKKEDNKKLILLSGVALVCILLSIFLKPEEKISMAEIPEEKNEVSNEIAQDDLESKLKNILSQINGAGDVDVMITLETSEEIQPAYNINSTNEQTSEKDQNGGERIVSTTSENKTMVTSNSNLPIIVTTKQPKIKGVIVVSSGASDPVVKETLYKAVQTALQVQGYQVEIFSK